MATAKIVLDTRRKNENNVYPLYLRVYHLDKTINISLNFKVKEKQWDGKTNRVHKAHPNSTRINNSIQNKLKLVSDIFIEKDSQLHGMCLPELHKLILEKIYDDPSKRKTTFKSGLYLLHSMQQYIDDLKRANRHGYAFSFKGVYGSFKKYINNKDIPLKSIDYKFLKKYETDCLNKGLKINSIGINLRSLRTVINRAIDEGNFNLADYPFRKYKIKKEATQKRYLPKEKLQEIFSLELPKESRLWHSQNYFTFMFHMRGMNFIDLAYLKPENIINGERVFYKRAKTGKPYNIKITKEAKKILDFYMNEFAFRPKYHLFPIIQDEIAHDPLLKRNRARNALKYFNLHLKEIAVKCGITTNLTSYVTRHSWASIAKFSGVNPAKIKDALGHADLKTTETYLAEFSDAEIDEANELVVS